MDLPETEHILNSLASYDVVYLSAITLSIYSENGRRRLMAALKRARLLGTRFAFDTNFRARGWPDLDIARSVFSDAFEAADIVLASTEDLLPLYPGQGNATLMAAHFQSGSGVETQRAGQRPAVRRRFARGEGRAPDKTCRRHHRGRRQFCGGLHRRTAGGRGPGRGRACRTSSRRRGRGLSRRDHSALCHAGQENAATGTLTQGISMTATPKQEKLVALFEQATIIPVLTIERLEDAVPLARALVAGGVRTLEITLRTPVAIESAKAIMADVPEAVVGIGTILNADDLARAEGIGAKFGISPGATPDLLKAAAASALPFAPGIATASELMLALSHGFNLVKFFPAEPSGGIKALRALAGPFPDVRFCPTGGIGEANAASWLAEPNVVAVGGSWLCPAADIRSGNWTGITAICNRTMKLLKPA